MSEHFRKYFDTGEQRESETTTVPEKESLKTIPELGLTYGESVSTLPPHRQSETGIKRIRRRKVYELPEGIDLSIFREVNIPPGHPGIKMESWHFKQYSYEMSKETRDKLIKIIDHLMDGHFVDGTTWNHKMSGDVAKLEGATERIFQEFKREGFLFRNILDKRNLTPFAQTKSGAYDSWGFMKYFKRNKDGLIVEIPEEDVLDDSAEYFALHDLSVSISPRIFRGEQVVHTPVFFFSGRKSVFVNYLENVLSNRETQKMLAIDGWYLGDERVSKEEDAVDCRKSIGILRKFASCQPLRPDDYTNHPVLPIIYHPDIPLLKWCHAEYALVPTSNKSAPFNLLRFETE